MQADLVLRATARADGVFTIHLAGVIDAHTLDKFEAALGKALEKGARSLLLDCEELRYVNSSGFGELIRYSDRLKERKGALVLTRVPPKVGVILEMLGLKSLIPIAVTLEAGLKTAARGAVAEPATPSPSPPEGRSRIGIGAAPSASASRTRRARPALGVKGRTVVCAFCDARLRITGEGRWACPSCGAPFTLTREGGVAFDWTRADSDAVHLTFDVAPRSLAAFAGLIEGVLVERRVSHARMRRFAREAAHVCHLLAEHALPAKRRGPLHVLVLGGPQRLHLRIVDRGRNLGEEASRIFATQARLFLDFAYSSPAPDVNVTEFAFAYAGSGIFVT